MVADNLIESIIKKKNPCAVGIDPDHTKIPICYKNCMSLTKTILTWAIDVIDTVADLIPAIKPQMAFFEMFGAEGIATHQRIVSYARERGLIVIDDCKRNDIGNTAKAYAFAHLANDGPINADFMTVSPFLGSDSIQPFIDAAIEYRKGIFVLVKTSNPTSCEISNALTTRGDKIQDYLANHINKYSSEYIGNYGYSGIGAVVGATFPNDAKRLRNIMKNSIFLVPGFGAQGGNANDIIPCFNEDGLGAIVNSSREITFKHLEMPEFDDSKAMYSDIVRSKTEKMRDQIYSALKSANPKMTY